MRKVVTSCVRKVVTLRVLNLLTSCALKVLTLYSLGSGYLDSGYWEPRGSVLVVAVTVAVII